MHIQILKKSSWHNNCTNKVEIYNNSRARRYSMLKNYLKITLRNIKRYKGYAFINTAGLAIGMACCILIVLYIQSELSFDRYHEKSERIYLLKRHGLYGGKELTSSSNNALSAVYMKKDFPEVENTARIGFMPDPAVKYQEKKFYVGRALYADDSFFEIFTYPMLKGDPKTALKAPFSVVITEEIADRYFGDEDPLGKSLRFNNQDDYTVTGVIENVPRNSHLLFDMLCSFRTQYSQNPKGHPFLDDFISNTFWTYVLLEKDADPRALEIHRKIRGQTTQIYREHHGVFPYAPNQNSSPYSIKRRKNRNRGDSLYLYLFPDCGCYFDYRLY
jgi:putative ABC transport system permease protein